jgi:cyanophycinase
VVGRGTVTIIDGARILHTDIHETPEAQPAALLGLSVHVLTQGCGFAIDPRTPTWIGQRAQRAPSKGEPRS